MDDRKLLELYRQNPMLWDTRLEEYKSSDQKPAVWNDIADQLSAPTEVVRNRIRNIRTVYKKWKQQEYRFKCHLTRIRPHRYKYAAECSFLDAVVVPTLMSENIPPLSGDSWDNADASSDDKTGIHNCSDHEYSGQSDGEDLAVPALSSAAASAAPAVARLETPIRRLKSKRSRTSHESASHPTSQFMTSDSSMAFAEVQHAVAMPQQQQQQLLNDGHFTFSMLVYNLMKDMPPGRVTDMCRIKIHQTILEFKYGAQSMQSAHP